MPLARLMLSDKGSMARTAAWALSNLIKGPDSRAAADLIKVGGSLDAIKRHLHMGDDELATEVAWVVVYLTALSDDALHVLAKSEVVPLLIGKLAASDNLQLLIPVMRGMPNGEGLKLVELEDGIDAMEMFQFHENEEMRIMANTLVDKYFGEHYGLDE